MMPIAHETPPPPATPRRVTFPTPVERRLPNGIRVIVIPKPGTGLVSAVLMAKTGGASDPDYQGKAGLADFTAALLTKGTVSRPAAQIAREIEGLGGSLSADAGWDSTSLNLSVMRANLAPALTVMVDVAEHPAFRPDEIVRLRTQRIDDLRVSLEEPGTLARYAVGRVVFGDTAYGHPLEGTPESLVHIQRADIVGYHARAFHPANCILVFGGDIKPDEAFAFAQSQFGDWKPAPLPPPAFSPISPRATNLPHGRIVVIDKPDAGQAAVFLALPTIRRAAPTYYAGEVANSVLGGGYSARLNHDIRVVRGLAYGAFSGIAPRAATGIFSASAQTKNPSAGEVASLLRDDLQQLPTAPLPASELTPRQANLTGDYARALETGGGLAVQVASLALYNLPLTELSDYLRRVRAVSAPEAKSFAAFHLPARDSDIVIVGNAKQFLPDLRKRFPGKKIEIIPVARLDLNHASLIKR